MALVIMSLFLSSALIATSPSFLEPGDSKQNSKWCWFPGADPEDPASNIDVALFGDSVP